MARTRYGAKGRLTQAMLNVSAISIIVMTLAALDEDVRRHVANAMSGDGATEMAAMAVPADRLMRSVLEAAGHYQAAHGPLLAFGVVALVLLGLMLRS